MTHELKDIITAYINAKSLGMQTVLVTVVALNGSSYRKPGVRMLVASNSELTGAISGGCVEKEIIRQSQSVFKSNRPLIMTYDGRYRIGCEGLLYILIEPFQPENGFIEAFDLSIENRHPIEINSFYHLDTGYHDHIGSEFVLNNIVYQASKFQSNDQTLRFTQSLPPCFRLYIFGTEHDAIALCNIASSCGWEIEIIAAHQSLKSINQFSGATGFHYMGADDLRQLQFDSQTAVILMSHNFAKDLNYLIQLAQVPTPGYIGVLGSTLRMDQLMTAVLERYPDVSSKFIELIHGPAGLNIHAITPQEIAISIVGQIISLIREQSNQTVSSSTTNLFV